MTPPALCIKSCKNVHIREANLLSVLADDERAIVGEKNSASGIAPLSSSRVSNLLAAGGIENMDAALSCRSGYGDGDAPTVGLRATAEAAAGSLITSGFSSSRPALAGSVKTLTVLSALQETMCVASALTATPLTGPHGHRATDKLPVGGVPNLDRLVVAAGDDAIKAAVEQCLPHRAGVARLPQQRQRPRPHRLVGAGGVDALAVAVKGHGEDRSLVREEFDKLAIQFVNTGLVVGSAHEQTCAIGLKLTPCTAEAVVIVACGLPSANVQTLTVLSAPPAAIRVPSLLSANVCTAAPCSNFVFDLPSAMFHTCTVLSALAEMS